MRIKKTGCLIWFYEFVNDDRKEYVLLGSVSMVFMRSKFMCINVLWSIKVLQELMDYRDSIDGRSHFHCIAYLTDKHCISLEFTQMWVYFREKYATFLLIFLKKVKV